MASSCRTSKRPTTWLSALLSMPLAMRSRKDRSTSITRLRFATDTEPCSRSRPFSIPGFSEGSDAGRSILAKAGRDRSETKSRRDPDATIAGVVAAVCTNDPSGDPGCGRVIHRRLRDGPCLELLSISSAWWAVRRSAAFSPESSQTRLPLRPI